MYDSFTPHFLLIALGTAILLLFLFYFCMSVLSKRVAGGSIWHFGHHMLKHISGPMHSGTSELIWFGFGVVDLALAEGLCFFSAIEERTFLITIVPH